MKMQRKSLIIPHKPKDQVIVKVEKIDGEIESPVEDLLLKIIEQIYREEVQ